jgi:NADP-dependent 3-hydroxy acid dehydrogenase YdfG
MAEESGSQRNDGGRAGGVAGKAILVTGGTTGIGRAAAKLLVQKGARVLVFGRHQEELDDAVNDIKGAGGGEIYGLTADVFRYDDVQKVFRAADQSLGGLDVLINNAALPAKSVKDTEYSEFLYIVQSNLVGYMACAQEAIRRFKKKGQGHLIDVGSMSAKSQEEGGDIYVATKSGIRGFTESLAKSLNKEGIRVSLIEPGLVGTDLGEASPEEQRKKEEEETMLKAEDIAECIYYCLSQPPRCDISLVQIRPMKQKI